MCGERRGRRKVGGFDSSKAVPVKKDLLLGVHEKRENMQYGYRRTFLLSLVPINRSTDNAISSSSPTSGSYAHAADTAILPYESSPSLPAPSPCDGIQGHIKRYIFATMSSFTSAHFTRAFINGQTSACVSVCPKLTDPLPGKGRDESILRLLSP